MTAPAVNHSHKEHDTQQTRPEARPGRLTIFTSDDKLCKTWRLDAAGKPVKTAAAQMTRGSYVVREFSTAAELAALWEGVTTHQAFSASLPQDGSADGEIVTKAAIAQHPGKRTRSKACFGLQAVPGVRRHDKLTP